MVHAAEERYRFNAETTETARVDGYLFEEMRD
jgi:hypothetical protein